MYVWDWQCEACVGLSAPVPRGRKGKKAKKDMRNLQLEENLASVSAEMERIISDDGYKKHLKRHANKWVLSLLVTVCKYTLCISIS